MFKGICICSAILLIVFGLAVTPALGVKVTVNTKETTAKTKCDLDNSAEFNEKTLGGSGGVYQKAEISGNGENSVEKKVSGDGYGVMSAFDASGTVNSQMSIATSGEGALLNTKTSISGGAGHIASDSSTEDNYMRVSGGFSGEGGDIRSDTTSAAFYGERAYAGGYASILGIECLDEKTSQQIASKENKALSVNGIYFASDGNMGDFGLLTINTEKGGNPAAKKPPNEPSDADEYQLTGWKLANPVDIKVANSYGNLGLDTVTGEISAATDEWNSALDTSTPRLFNSVESASGYALPNDPKSTDGSFVHAWTNREDIMTDSRIIAVTYTWRGLPRVDKKYWSVVESDCYYNSDLTWYKADDEGVIDTSKVDVQTIALHELGHTAGLDDLYSTGTTDQVMHGYYYGESDWSLGIGDIAGIQKLYG